MRNSWCNVLLPPRKGGGRHVGRKKRTGEGKFLFKRGKAAGTEPYTHQGRSLRTREKTRGRGQDALNINIALSRCNEGQKRQDEPNKIAKVHALGKSRTRWGRHLEFGNLPKKVDVLAEHVRRGPSSERCGDSPIARPR
jgi:hypothetical protein